MQSMQTCINYNACNTIHVNPVNANLYKIYTCNTIHVNPVNGNLYKLYACNTIHVNAIDANCNDHFHTYCHLSG